jgi:hypothetical protein
MPDYVMPGLIRYPVSTFFFACVTRTKQDGPRVEPGVTVPLFIWGDGATFYLG